MNGSCKSMDVCIRYLTASEYTIMNYIGSTITHRSEELLHISGISVDDELVNFLVSDFAKHLPVRARTSLAYVHFGSR